MAAVISDGMKYESIAGSGQMIPRPDLGNDRTVETVMGDMPVKTMDGGQAKQIDTISLKQALDFVNLMYGKK